jgi:hypothetical protein
MATPVLAPLPGEVETDWEEIPEWSLSVPVDHAHPCTRTREDVEMLAILSDVCDQVCESRVYTPDARNIIRRATMLISGCGESYAVSRDALVSVLTRIAAIANVRTQIVIDVACTTKGATDVMEELLGENEDVFGHMDVREWDTILAFICEHAHYQQAVVVLHFLCGRSVVCKIDWHAVGEALRARTIVFTECLLIVDAIRLIEADSSIRATIDWMGISIGHARTMV